MNLWEHEVRKTNLVIDVYGAVNIESSALILEHKTGVYYTAQCDGIGCSHPAYEGILLDFGSSFEEFDDCDFGCNHISDADNHEGRLKLAAELDKIFKEHHQKLTYKISFDYDRINDLMEGWWPIIFKGSYFDVDYGERKGIIHTGNCD